MKIKTAADVSGDPESLIVTDGVNLPAVESVAAIVIPQPPGGGSWRWTGAEWKDLNPQPAAEVTDSSNQTPTE